MFIAGEFFYICLFVYLTDAIFNLRLSAEYQLSVNHQINQAILPITLCIKYQVFTSKLFKNTIREAHKDLCRASFGDSLNQNTLCIIVNILFLSHSYINFCTSRHSAREGAQHAD